MQTGKVSTALARSGALALCVFGGMLGVPAQQPAGPGTGTAGEVTRFEAGFAAADLRTGCIGRRGCTQPSAAIGVAGALNLTPQVSLTGSWLVTPTAASATTNEAGGHASELLAGARGELRARHFGYFAEGQAGYLRWSGIVQSAAFTSPTTIVFTFGPRTELVTSVGAGAEFSPTPRVHLRGEVADLLLDQGGTWSQHLQPSAGVFYGLGRPVPFADRSRNLRPAHRFLDWKNLAALGIGELGTTADLVTTYEFTRRGYTEGDPIARPLVKYGLPGDVALQGIELGLEIAGMYGFHRLHVHWAERVVPLALGTVHGVFAYDNTKGYSRSRFLNAGSAE